MAAFAVALAGVPSPPMRRRRPQGGWRPQPQFRTVADAPESDRLLTGRPPPLDAGFENGAHESSQIARIDRFSDHKQALILQTLSQNNQASAVIRRLLTVPSQLSDTGPDYVTLSVLMLCYAANGNFSQAQAAWTELINSSSVPEVDVIWCLIDAYSRASHHSEIFHVLDEVASRGHELAHEIHVMAVSCFGDAGELALMEAALDVMDGRGFPIDAATANAVVIHYCRSGSVSQIQHTCRQLKKSGIAIERNAIRAVAAAYIDKRRMYELGEFCRDAGLGRRDVGNLLWNLLLLSCASEFKMKTLQREFLNMVGAGFSPDLGTFNIRALAFSRMCMFWDLHLTAAHMARDGVVLDLVTCGCFVDAYVERGLIGNLPAALGKLGLVGVPAVRTDPLVFRAFGKGDFQVSTETLLRSSAARRRWTYSGLLQVYLKKMYRTNQIFWNC